MLLIAEPGAGTFNHISEKLSGHHCLDIRIALTEFIEGSKRHTCRFANELQNANILLSR